MRSQATVCGNLAHGDPANDHPATMLALGATVVATGPKGQREIAIEDFFPASLLTELILGANLETIFSLPDDRLISALQSDIQPARLQCAYFLSKLFVLV